MLYSGNSAAVNNLLSPTVIMVLKPDWLKYASVSSFSQNGAKIYRSQRGYSRGYEADDEPRGRQLEEAGGDDPHPPVPPLQRQPCRVQHGAGRLAFSPAMNAQVFL